MKVSKFFLVLTLVMSILSVQIGTVFAAPALQEGSISGTVTGLECDTNEATGVTTMLVTVDETLTVRISQETAEELGLITVVDGIPDCSEEALAEAIGTEVTIDSEDVIPEEPEEEETQHPVGAALADFFAGIADYETIMAAHEEGFGFGVIAQALWLTTKLEGDATTLSAILLAKETGDYSAFVLEDGSTPTSWGQFRKAVLSGDKKNNLGVVMSNKGNGNGNGNPGQGQGNSNEHGNGNGNAHGNGNPGQGHGNENSQEHGNGNNNRDRGGGNGD